MQRIAPQDPGCFLSNLGIITNDKTLRYGKTQAESRAEPIPKCFPNATLEARGVPQGPVSCLLSKLAQAQFERSAPTETRSVCRVQCRIRTGVLF